MKKKAIIPIFIPHKGCPNDCVFCNQKKITARQTPPELTEVRSRIEAYLPTLLDRRLQSLEIAFFGGSFTGIPIEEQSAYLAIAREYKERGLIQGIRLSTRPDYIDEAILTNLRAYDVDVIELGAQSFDEEVLRRANRGHSAAAIAESAAMIHAYGFELGIQLMIGLPGDTREKALHSAEEAVKLAPSAARLYPTVVLEDTALYDDWAAGRFRPFDQPDMVDITKEMYRILVEAGIPVIRVGLKSTDLISAKQGSAAAPGTYHPAFRQLVCGELAKEELERQLLQLLSTKSIESTESTESREFKESAELSRRRVLFESSGESFSNMIGNRAVNRRYFAETYPEQTFRFGRKDTLENECYLVSWEERKENKCHGEYRK